MGSLERRANRLGAAMGALGAAMGMAFALREVFQMADAWASVNARVSLVTNGAEEQKFVTESLYNIAVKTRQEYVTTADLYGKIARNAKELSLTQNDILGLTEDINKALIIGGGNTQENQAAVLQLGQALASGRLQGDEFRSLMENAPRLTNAIAEGMGVGIGQLRSMSKAGELTAKVVIDAIRSQSAKLEKEFMQMPTTIGQAITGVGLRVGKFLQDLEKETGVFKSIAQGIAKVFGAIDDEIRAASTRVGGFKNVLKIATAAVIAFGIAWVVVREGLYTLELWRIALQILKINVVAVGRAFLAWLMNPAFLTVAAITLSIIAVALALEDVYYWVTGGNSVLGKYVGSWDEFKAKALTYLQPIIDGFNELVGVIKSEGTPAIMAIKDGFISAFNVIVALLTPIVQWIIAQFMDITNNGQVIFSLLLTIWQGIVSGIVLALKFLTQVFTGNFSGAIDTVVGFFKNLLSTALSVLQQIGTAIGTYVLSKLGWAGQAIAKLAGMDLTKGMINASLDVNSPTGTSKIAANNNYGINLNPNLDLAGTSTRNNNVTINQTNQLLAGTPAGQVNFVQDATEDMFNQRLVTGMQYSL